MTRVHAEVCAAINRRDYDTQRRVTAREFVHDDRRPLVGLDDQGRRGMTLNHELMLDQGYEILPPEPMAVRGDRLALSLVRARTAAGDESNLLALNELDVDGLFVRSTAYGETDLVGALDELDARFLAGEGSGHPTILGLGFGIQPAMRMRAWDWFETNVADEFRFVDHQRLGFGDGDRAYFIEIARSTVESSDAFLIYRKLFVARDTVLAVTLGEGANADGGAVSWSFHIVVHADEQCRFDAMEWFDEDDFDAALARFDELGAAAPAEPRSPVAMNAASRFMERLRHAFNDPDSGALGQLLARDRVHDDRRSIVALVDVDDRGRLAEFAAASEQGFSFVEPEVIAVRGERLALTRMVARTAAGDESARLSVNELDADGRLAYSALFDDDDLPAAMEELDRRFFVGEGVPYQRVLRACARFAAASDRDDFEALRDGFAPDFVSVDHQLLGSGVGDRDYFTEFSRTRTAEGSLVNRVMYVNEHALLTVHHSQMTSDQGGVYERVVCIVMRRRCRRSHQPRSSCTRTTTSTRLWPASMSSAHRRPVASGRPGPRICRHASSTGGPSSSSPAGSTKPRRSSIPMSSAVTTRRSSRSRRWRAPSRTPS